MTFLLGPFAIGIGVTGAAGGAILGGVAYAASFIIGLVVGIFGPYMDDLIRKIFSKSSKKDTDSTL
ncbi:hypothetical protein AKI86_08935 [Streptococcus pneumoniae]|nr:hypothetical protein AKI86_08935 [Streptococcus pneumoniae]